MTSTTCFAVSQSIAAMTWWNLVSSLVILCRANCDSLVESEFWCVDPESWELTATALTWAISKNYVLEVGVTNVEARDVVVD